MNASMRRVAQALQERGLAAEVRKLPDSTRTAPEAAVALGCDVAEIAKSLVFRGTESGDRVLALERVWAAAGTPRAVFGPVTPAELVRATGGRVVAVAQ